MTLRGRHGARLRRDAVDPSPLPLSPPEAGSSAGQPTDAMAALATSRSAAHDVVDGVVKCHTIRIRERDRSLVSTVAWGS